MEFSFSSTQFNLKSFGVSETFYGSQGVAQSPYSGPLGIEGRQPWTWSGNPAASPNNNLAESDMVKDRDFIASITSGKLQNQIPAGVETARTCMMGRKSAETGRAVTWDEMENDSEAYNLGFDIKRFA